MPETLIIVHLSSLDGYTAYYGVDTAQTMVNDLRMAIVTHAGPVVVMDQGWPEISPDAKHLRQMVLDMQSVSTNMTIFHHDELMDIAPWQDGMRALAKVLRSLKTHRVRLGGFWASHNATSGCVHEVQRQLRTRNIPCSLDKQICALEENDRRALEV